MISLLLLPILLVIIMVFIILLIVLHWFFFRTVRVSAFNPLAKHKPNKIACGKKHRMAKTHSFNENLEIMGCPHLNCNFQNENVDVAAATAAHTHTHTYTPILNQIKWYNFSLDFLVLFLYSLCRLGERSTALLLWLLPFCVVYYLYFVRLCRLWWCIQFLCFFATSFFCCCCCFCFAWIALELHKFETSNDSI